MADQTQQQGNPEGGGTQTAQISGTVQIKPQGEAAGGAPPPSGWKVRVTRPGPGILVSAAR